MKWRDLLMVCVCMLAAGFYAARAVYNAGPLEVSIEKHQRATQVASGPQGQSHRVVSWTPDATVMDVATPKGVLRMTFTKR